MRTRILGAVVAIATIATIAATANTASAECLEWSEKVNGSWLPYRRVTVDQIDGNVANIHWSGAQGGTVWARLRIDRDDRSAMGGETVFKGKWENDRTGRWGRIRLYLRKGSHTARGYVRFKDNNQENEAKLRECGGGRASIAVKGRNVAAVWFPDGRFATTGNGRWTEYGSRGEARFYFVETHRDEWSVYLHDRSRNMRLQIDMYRKQIRLAEGGGYRDLYPITRATK